MLEALFNFFSSLFYTENYDAYPYGSFLDDNFHINMGDYYISTSTGQVVQHAIYDISVGDYLALLCSIISLILIVVLCCLFVYKIIKLVGNLIR